MVSNKFTNIFFVAIFHVYVGSGEHNRQFSNVCFII